MNVEAGQYTLKKYLDFNGILTCNENPYLPSLNHIGCEWCDVTALIDSHDLFYCKAYRKRTTYLSKQVYFLLKHCRTIKPLDDTASRVYELLESLEFSDMETLKQLSAMDSKTFTKAFNYLLENLYVTAFKNGKILNPNWSTFVYCTAETWEKSVDLPCINGEPRTALREILLKTMPKKEFNLFVKTRL